MTGKELNKRTRSYSYNGFACYVLIWFDQDEVAIIELTSPVFGVRDEFTGEDFKRAFRFGMELDGDQANSRSPRRWHFQAKRGFRWIDPRADQ